MTARMSSRTPLAATTPDLELVAAAQAGNADAFDVLVDRYRRFVRSRSRGYFLVGGDRDDLEQEALGALALPGPTPEPAAPMGQNITAHQAPRMSPAPPAAPAASAHGPGLACPAAAR